MMRAILIFNLPDEVQEYEAAHRGMRYRLALHDLAEQLRSRIKYGQLEEQSERELREIQELLYTLVPNLDDE